MTAGPGRESAESLNPLGEAAVDALLCALGCRRAVFLCQRNGLILYVSPDGSDALKQKRCEIVGRTWAELDLDAPFVEAHSFGPPRGGQDRAGRDR